jgi:hypothetical protein
MSQTLRERSALRDYNDTRVFLELTKEAASDRAGGFKENLQWWLAAFVIAPLFLSVLVWSAEHDAKVAEQERIEREARMKRSPCTLKEVERHPYPYSACIATVYKL